MVGWERWIFESPPAPARQTLAAMQTRRIISIITLLTFFSCQDRDNGAKTSVESTRKEYVPGIYYLSSQIDSIIDPAKEESKCHEAAIAYSNIGKYLTAIKAYDQCEEEKGLQSVFYDSTNFNFIPAIDHILREAKEKQIIIINEAHHVSYHRFFTMTLLEKLSKLGFNYFGAETLALWDSTLSKTKYPTKTIGFYTSEPQYSNLVREALRTGYKVFAYEPNEPGDGQSREIGQAKNIKKILDKDPKAKIIIHCGYAHLYEDKVEGWGKAMTGRLIEYTKIDPLTIDQVELTEHSDPKYENPYYGRLHFKDFIVPVNNGKMVPISFRLDGHLSDMYVYHPRTYLKHNRPHWLFSHYTPTFINKDINISFPVLAKAYISTENENDAVPVDIIEIKSKNDTTALALIPKTSYKILITNRDKQKQTIELKVD